MILTIRYTPPGAPGTDSLHLELYAEPGSRLDLQLSAPPRLAVPFSEPAHQSQSVVLASGVDIPGPRSTKDWDQPGLPLACAPGRVPELLTDAQAHARMRYGYQQGWAQRRIAAFAGRATGTVNKHLSRLKEKDTQ
ncbi:helix-turn-helix domain-containing protein [Streptomyces halstedii]|uniref:Helix-turn-helix domain-containing protein n=1 Tax=Streptomyces halstedii TaxID=1944 RepID=A0A6N9U3X9_STRHA|nr:helix-turn-helix domain-containing protein [Streptomyces halstedii]NEA18510.1 helix-turn-helix domain-containing protein [Streptomyces halstedii]